MFWFKKKPDKETLEFLEGQRIFYNKQVNYLKWLWTIEDSEKSNSGSKLSESIEELLPSIVDLIRGYGARPVFDPVTQEIIKLEW